MSSPSDDPLTVDSGHPLYERIVNLGRAPTGSTFTQVARNKQTGELVSIKFLRRGWGKDVSTSLMNANFNHMELSVCGHPHVVEFKEAFLMRDHLAIVMEYVEGETVETFLERVGGKVIEALARFMFQQLIIAVDFCHRQGKLLRDIKPSTLLLNIREGTLPLLKLCDFAVSKDVTRRDHHPASGGGTAAGGEVSEGQVGSALFVAPEAMQDPTGASYDGKAADLWSCGVITYISLFGQHPFIRDQDEHLGQNEKLVAMLQRILRDEAEFVGRGLPAPPTAAVKEGGEGGGVVISDACRDLLRGLLVCDPKQRLTTAQIMKHPWFLEALPSGADVMNDLLVQDCPQLSPPQVALFQALIKKASIDDKDCGVETPVIGAKEGAGNSQTRVAVSSGAAPQTPHSEDSAFSNRLRLVLDSDTQSWLGELPSSEGAAAGAVGGGAPRPPPSPHMGFSPSRRLLQQASLKGAAGSWSAGSNLSGSSGSLLGRILNGLVSPGPLSSASGLSDALMRFPTEVLLKAAVEDIIGDPRGQAGGGGGGSLTGADWDFGMMGSPSFLQGLGIQFAGVDGGGASMTGLGSQGGRAQGLWFTEGLGVAAGKRRSPLLGQCLSSSSFRRGGGLLPPHLIPGIVYPSGGGEGRGGAGVGAEGIEGTAAPPLITTSGGGGSMASLPGSMASLLGFSAADLWTLMQNNPESMTGRAPLLAAGGSAAARRAPGRGTGSGRGRGSAAAQRAPGRGPGAGNGDELNWQMQADPVALPEDAPPLPADLPDLLAPAPFTGPPPFPMWDSPDTVPVASLSAMDMSFNWASFGGEALGGASMVMDFPASFATRYASKQAPCSRV